MNFDVPNLTVYVTNRCNLSCTYCYQGRSNGNSASRMSLETGKQTMDWFVRQASGESKELVCTFFGGEPLLEFELIRRLVEYGEEQGSRCGKRITFGITTNVTRFTPRVQRFWKEHKMLALLSLDGAERSQNLNRRLRNRSGSFKLVEEAIPLVLEILPRATARMTVTPDTMHNLLENVQFLVEEKGFVSVAPYPVEQGWTEDSLMQLDEEYRKVANWYVQRAIEDRYVSIEFIVNNMQKVAGTPDGERLMIPCGVGKGYLAVSADGGIYPCHRFVSSGNFRGAYRTGDVWKGIDEWARSPFLRLTAENMLGCHVLCPKCEARSVCGGGCAAQNHEMTGNLFFPIRYQHYFSHIYFDIGRQVLALLRDKAPHILEKHVLPPPDQERKQMLGEGITRC